MAIELSLQGILKTPEHEDKEPHKVKKVSFGNGWQSNLQKPSVKRASPLEKTASDVRDEIEYYKKNANSIAQVLKQKRAKLVEESPSSKKPIEEEDHEEVQLPMGIETFEETHYQMLRLECVDPELARENAQGIVGYKLETLQDRYDALIIEEAKSNLAELRDLYTSSRKLLEVANRLDQKITNLKTSIDLLKADEQYSRESEYPIQREKELPELIASAENRINSLQKEKDEVELLSKVLFLENEYQITLARIDQLQKNLNELPKEIKALREKSKKNLPPILAMNCKRDINFLKDKQKEIKAELGSLIEQAKELDREIRRTEEKMTVVQNARVGMRLSIFEQMIIKQERLVESLKNEHQATKYQIDQLQREQDIAAELESLEQKAVLQSEEFRYAEAVLISFQEAYDEYLA